MTAPKKTKDASALLAAIARKHLGFETLETRHSDGHDFHEVSVWGVRAALQAAFEAGQRAEVSAKPTPHSGKRE
jgi:hypothetical protein